MLSFGKPEILKMNLVLKLKNLIKLRMKRLLMIYNKVRLIFFD